LNYANDRSDEQEGSSSDDLAYSYPHLLRLFQLIRLLSRDPNIMELLICKNGIKIVSDRIRNLQRKVSNDSENDNNKFLLIELISIAKRMYLHLETFGKDKENEMNAKGKGLLEKHHQMNDKQILEELLEPLQLLLKCKNNVLLM